jgi:hypothetical protein
MGKSFFIAIAYLLRYGLLDLKNKWMSTFKEKPCVIAVENLPLSCPNQ